MTPSVSTCLKKSEDVTTKRVRTFFQLLISVRGCKEGCHLHNISDRLQHHNGAILEKGIDLSQKDPSSPDLVIKFGIPAVSRSVTGKR